MKVARTVLRGLGEPQGSPGYPAGDSAKSVFQNEANQTFRRPKGGLHLMYFVSLVSSPLFPDTEVSEYCVYDVILHIAPGQLGQGQQRFFKLHAGEVVGEVTGTADMV